MKRVLLLGLLVSGLPLSGCTQPAYQPAPAVPVSAACVGTTGSMRLSASGRRCRRPSPRRATGRMCGVSRPSSTSTGPFRVPPSAPGPREVYPLPAGLFVGPSGAHAPDRDVKVRQ